LKILISLFLTLFISYANNLKTITSYQASFSQSIINNSGKEIKYEGEIFVQNPSNIFWKYNNPIQKNVYIINSNVTIIEPELEQAIISKLDKEFNILKLLKEAKKISKNIYISNIYNNKYTLFIDDNKLQSIRYKDNIDNKITISFNNIKQNKKLPKNIFDFNIPLEYDIIRK